VRLGRFTSITEVWNWIEQYFQQYEYNIKQILEYWQIYEIDPALLAELLRQGLSFYEEYRPDTHPETYSVDGDVQRYVDPESWAALRGGAGTAHSDETKLFTSQFRGSTIAGKWDNLRRPILLFNTSGIPDNALITAAKLRVRVSYKSVIGTNAPALTVVNALPASNTDLVNADYQLLGAAPLTTIIPVTYFVVGYFSEFIFAPSSFGVINKQGITKLGIREYRYDCLGATPIWTESYTGYQLDFNSAEEVAATRPHLCVNYFVPGE
jgi:hypothetical protein